MTGYNSPKSLCSNSFSTFLFEISKGSLHVLVRTLDAQVVSLFSRVIAQSLPTHSCLQRFLVTITPEKYVPLAGLRICSVWIFFGLLPPISRPAPCPNRVRPSLGDLNRSRSGISSQATARPSECSSKSFPPVFAAFLTKYRCQPELPFAVLSHFSLLSITICPPVLVSGASCISL